MTWETASWANGPRLVKWLEGQQLTVGIKNIDSTFDRRLTAWRAGDQASFWVVDKLLTKYHYHVSEIPDDVWEQRREFKSWGEWEPRYCVVCGEEIPRALNQGRPEGMSRYGRKKFCSDECYQPGYNFHGGRTAV